MADVIGQVLNLLLGLLGAGIVGVGLFILILESKYKHHITVKKVVNGNVLVTHDKFRTKKDKQGIGIWKLRKTKKELPPFPNDCVALDIKGKLYAQCYQLSEVTFIPIKDTFDPNNEKEYDEVIKTLQPYSASQRALLVNQHAKAERNRKKTMAEMLSAAVPYMAVVMIIIMFMIFYGDAVQPIKEMADSSVKHWETVTANIAKATENLDSIINDKQHLISESLSNSTQSPVPN